MSEGNTNQEPTEPTPAEPTQPDDLSNSAIKNSPLFQKVTSQLAALQNEKNEREQKEADAASKAEQDALIAKGDFEKALSLRDETIKAMETRHAADIMQRDLKAELYNAGFKNETFVKGAIGSYDGAADGIGDFVSQLAGDESNAMFLGGAAPKREVLGGTSNISISGGAMSLEKLRQLATDKSSTPEKRSEARMALLEKIESGG